MAKELEKLELKTGLVDTFASVDRTSERVIGLIGAMKSTITADKAKIDNSDLLEAAEKTEMKAEYNARMVKVKAAIESALG